GVSTRHNPEFTMLEFYEAFATYEDLMQLTEELLRGLCVELTGETSIAYGEHVLDFGQPFRRLSVYEGLALAGVPRDLVFDRPTLEAAAAGLGIKDPGGIATGYLQMEIFEAAHEASLIQPTFVTDFPLEVSPLSRQKEADPALVDRFELYVAGRECANAFSELNDPQDQRARFEAQVARRQGGDQDAHPMDEDYVRALEHGMPPAAGEGIGIDRLVMFFTNSASIRDVILFPLLRPEA
ncbi:MAG: lysine--tRNA ligase, partial [Myxococcales bacterium]|nr:lysine--tRNA ligase [Myxococcales bacterium]